LTTFRAEELKAQLWAMGFSDVIHLTPAEAHKRYLKNRRDGLKALRRRPVSINDCSHQLFARGVP